MKLHSTAGKALVALFSPALPLLKATLEGPTTWKSHQSLSMVSA